MSELRRMTMDACLQVSRDAIAIFDALEARDITMETAKAILRMGRAAKEIHLALQTIAVTEGVCR